MSHRSQLRIRIVCYRVHAVQPILGNENLIIILQCVEPLSSAKQSLVDLVEVHPAVQVRCRRTVPEIPARRLLRRRRPGPIRDHRDQCRALGGCQQCFAAIIGVISGVGEELSAMSWPTRFPASSRVDTSTRLLLWRGRCCTSCSSRSPSNRSRRTLAPGHLDLRNPDESLR